MANINIASNKSYAQFNPKTKDISLKKEKITRPRRKALGDISNVKKCNLNGLLDDNKHKNVNTNNRHALHLEKISISKYEKPAVNNLKAKPAYKLNSDESDDIEYMPPIQRDKFDSLEDILPMSDRPSTYPSILTMGFNDFSVKYNYEYKGESLEEFLSKQELIPIPLLETDIIWDPLPELKILEI